MKDIIRNILNKASEERDLELAEIASDLMGKFAVTCNCPENWRNIVEELTEEYKHNDWIMDSVYEFSCYAGDDEEG